MSVSVDNITALKTVLADANKLRFVESEKAWFWSDPFSSEAADNVVVIEPNSGGGRWYKAYARESTPSDWSWTLVTSAPSTQSASNKSGYMCNASSTNTITITLPASASRGHTVRIKKLDASGWNRRIIIDRNSHNINGAASNVSFPKQHTDAQLMYVDSTVGWSVSSNYEPTSESSAVTLTHVSDGDTNGVIYYIGTARNTVAFANPAQTKVGVYATNTSGNTAVSFSAVTDRLVGSTFTNHLYGSSLYICLSVDTSRQLRLSKLSLRSSSGSADYAWRGFNIWGGYSSEVSSITELAPYTKVNWQLLKQFVNDGTMPAGNSQWGTYTIDSPKFYDLYRINGFEPYPGEAGGTYLRLGEVELYGDLIW